MRGRRSGIGYLMVAVGAAIRCSWEPQFGGRSPAQFAAQPDETIGLLGESINHAQAESAALPWFLGREERLHHLLELVWRDPRSRVNDRQSDIIAGGQVRVVAGRQGSVLHADRDRASRRHGVPSIDDEID